MTLPTSPSHWPSEFELIARLTDGIHTGDDVVRSIGDDAALVVWDPSKLLVITCDAQVENTHFKRSYSSPDQIGRRALSVNLSDIAAMGAHPRYALVSLIIQPADDMSWVESMYAGLRAQAAAFDVSIIGGNIASTTGPTCIDITLIGEVLRTAALRRDGGQVGDRVYVSGDLGAATAGLATFTADVSAVPAAALEEVRSAYREPIPQVALGEALSQSGVVNAMLDLSDGFSSDLHHLCDQSKVGADIEQASLPISTATRVVGEALGISPLDWALHGGDGYQLLFTVPANREARLAALPSEFIRQLRPIGWLTPSEHGVQVRAANGSARRLYPGGWDHLKGHRIS